ncbi:DUF624 domain-containing protein [Gracilibacillus phocaeensis]|uniref:DUF624 domain-containing protein n=1 Tax=Gracilibacillus phocaeensis TaxID=2042304 RepID=UPI001031EDFB|nr:DUF624 domain-containing protein [Gracilibacillus phocaeensis]
MTRVNTAELNRWNSTIISICSFVSCMFYANFSFLMTNSLLIYYVLLQGFNLGEPTGFWFVICCIPLGPSLVALFSTMKIFIDTKEFSFTQYWKSYFQNFKQSLLAWFCLLFIICFLYKDIEFFQESIMGSYIVPFFWFLFIICLLSMLYFFPLLAMFHLKTWDLMKYCFSCVITYWKTTIVLIFTIVLAVNLTYLFPSYMTLFVFSLTSYTILLLLREVQMDTRKKIKEEN